MAPALGCVVFWLIYAGAACEGRRHPGPCSASSPAAEITWTYDAEGRWTEISMVAPSGYAFTFTRSFEGNDLVSMEDVRDQIDFRETTRVDVGDPVTMTMWDGDCLHIEINATFERDGYELAGHPSHPTPYAPDAQLAFRKVFTDFCQGGEPIVRSDLAATYRFDGPPRQGLRTRTGSDGSLVTFQYDDAGRLLESAVTAAGDLWPTHSEVVAWERDGARLTEIRSTHPYAIGYWDGQLIGNTLLMTTAAITRYEYDGAGNLVRSAAYNASGTPSSLIGQGPFEYDYGCW